MPSPNLATAFRVCATVLVLLGNPLVAQSIESWQMQVGDMRVLSVPDIARVAVGDGHVVNAVTTDEKEVIVFARNDGTSAVQVWRVDGSRTEYLVHVTPGGVRQAKSELRQLLSRIPGIELSDVGDKIVVEGAHLTDSQRGQLQALSLRYPQLLDLSDAQGWDDMVLLDVQVVEVPRNAMRDLGVRWGQGSLGGMNAGLAWEGAASRLGELPGERPFAVAAGTQAMSGYFGLNALLSSRVHALSEIGAATVLAQPQLLARSGTTAEFLAGGEVPYTTTDSNGTSSTEFKSYGVSLRITPLIQRSGAVRSQIEVEVSSIGPSLSLPSGPSLKTRRAATEFNVQSGQTLVLAGFISRELSRNIDRVPGFGQLPILGRLFSSERFRRNETELAIFVTPVVVDATHPDMQERVHRAEALLQQQFGETEVMNTRIRDQGAKGADATKNGGRPEWAMTVRGLEDFTQRATFRRNSDKHSREQTQTHAALPKQALTAQEADTDFLRESHVKP
ncbi:pilus assembly protein N-terminal domain-containing protein [Paenalcaligenes niemegkensis]|uniref:type II and III secretion system protein family protein n=1 Tax=Paenalcaligenes niemegkensis TaxID=2895469 RepID=UPI001EE99F38|nr:pilus assembly protein N-terminal domain-containing protein [Paenalcaligenes niemegkensis]MCQ9616206.1 pilus assembly protein N-terminal domain-containing protein [Paenalcaligenes niemegkensis]